MIFLTLFGTPLLFAAVYDPPSKHIVDTLALTAATYAFMRIDSPNAAHAAVALGALCGWLLNTRWANVAWRVLARPAGAGGVAAGWQGRHQWRLDVQNDAGTRWDYLIGLLHGCHTACIHPEKTEC